jgi:anti-anti-sigma factor
MGSGAPLQGEASAQSPSPSLPAAGSHAFSLRVEELGSTFRLHLTGEFDLAGVGRVEAALERVSDEYTRHVVFDLTNLSFLDSAGLHTILRANERAHSAAFDVAVVRPRGLANRVFTLTRAGQGLNFIDGTVS